MQGLQVKAGAAGVFDNADHRLRISFGIGQKGQVRTPDDMSRYGSGAPVVPLSGQRLDPVGVGLEGIAHVLVADGVTGGALFIAVEPLLDHSQTGARVLSLELNDFFGALRPVFYGTVCGAWVGQTRRPGWVRPVR